MTLLDFDTVSLSNLQRQTLHSDATSAKPKSSQQKRHWRASIPTFSSPLLTPCWMRTRCSRKSPGMTWCWTAPITSLSVISSMRAVLPIKRRWFPAIRMEGQISVFTYAEGEPCYRCLSRLFGENALTCVEAGVMAPLVGVIGSMQAMEAIKVLTTHASGRQNRDV
jgi:adenylyltransferase/sulfurtransferase